MEGFFIFDRIYRNTHRQINQERMNNQYQSAAADSMFNVQNKNRNGQKE